MGKKSTTFDDIARYTNFSKTTISRFFNNPDSLTPKNQEIIRQALVDLDYKENKVAQILAKGKTEYIGVIVPNLYLHYFSEMLNQILLTYKEFGYKFLVFVGDSDAQTEKRYVQELLSYQIEGMIVLSHTLPSLELSQLGIPIVSIEREDRYISSVNCDNYMGAIQAVSLLAKQGCDILIHINTPTGPEVPAIKRLTGFRDFCSEYHIPNEIFIRDMGNNYLSIQQAMYNLLVEIEEKYPDQRKGIFFSDDTRANCFLNLLVRKYRELPDSYRLVGFDNSPIAQEAIYPITTVGQQITLIAHEAVSLLVQLIEQRKEHGDGYVQEPIHKVITPVIYRRETTKQTDL